SLGETATAGNDDCPHRAGVTVFCGQTLACLHVDNAEHLSLAQISNTLLRSFSYNDIHNRRVALGITCTQCTPAQLEVLRRAGATPTASRRCGVITRREAERLVKSFVEDSQPLRLPADFVFNVRHSCGWGCVGSFMPARYNSSRAKCIKCGYCDDFFSPNKFLFHFHRSPDATYRHPDAANFNSWRRHLSLDHEQPPEALVHVWEDVKAIFNSGKRNGLGAS
ncbi:SKI family transcriptional corepressor 2, partial [Lamellibrachia satsuma]